MYASTSIYPKIDTCTIIHIPHLLCRVSARSLCVICPCDGETTLGFPRLDHRTRLTCSRWAIWPGSVGFKRSILALAF